MSCSCHEKGTAPMKNVKEKLRAGLACTCWHNRIKERTKPAENGPLPNSRSYPTYQPLPQDNQTFFCHTLQMNIQSWPELRPDLGCPYCDGYQVENQAHNCEIFFPKMRLITDSIPLISAYEHGGSGTGSSLHSSPADGCIVFWQCLSGNEKGEWEKGDEGQGYSQGLSLKTSDKPKPWHHPCSELEARLSRPLLWTQVPKRWLSYLAWKVPGAAHFSTEALWLGDLLPF